MEQVCCQQPFIKALFIYYLVENELNDTPGWADFGGGSKPNESLLDVATREGSEELNGLLGSQSALKKVAVRHKIAELKYHSYTTIVFKTQYDDKLQQYYLNNYRFFEKYLPGAKKNPHNGLLEKSEIKWFTFDELRKNRGKFRSFYQNMVDIILEHEDEITNKLMKPICGPKCSFKVARGGGGGALSKRKTRNKVASRSKKHRITKRRK